VRQPLN
jgi:hypothetical protein